MDLNKLSTGDKVIGISGILLLIFSFFPWYGLDAFGVSYSENGWDDFLFGTLPVLIGIALVVLVIVQRMTDANLPDVGSLSWGQVSLIAAAVAAALVILKLLIGADRFGVDLDRKFGIFLAVLAALGLVAGGFLKMQEDRAGATGGTAPPPPPRA